MSCDDTTNRAWWIALLVLLVIGAGVWGLYLYGRGSAYPIHAPDPEDARRRVINGDMLGAAGDATGTHRADLVGAPGGVGDRTTAARGPVAVRAIGPTGVPLANVTVTLFEQDGDKRTTREAQTSGHGQATFSDVRLDGSARAVLLHGDQAGAGSTECASARVDSNAVDLHSNRGLPIVIELVRTDYCASVDVLIQAIPFFSGLAGALPSLVTPVAIEPGPLAQVRAHWQAVPGYAGHTFSYMQFPFPPDVHGAAATRPLRREADVVLVARSGERLPGARPTQAIVSLGRMRYTRERFEVDGFGRVRVRGVPMWLGLPATVVVYFADGSIGRGRTHSGSGPSLSLMFELEISKDEEPVIKDEEPVIKDEEIEDHTEVGVSDSTDPGASAGKVTLELTRIDGTPGKGAWAVLRPLDGGPNNWRKANERGEVHWTSRPPGRHLLSVWGIGATHTQEVEVVTGKVTRETIQGSAGGRLRVTVRDHDGRVLPFAWVRVTDSDIFRHADVRGRRLRTDPYTDRMGKRNFYRLRLGTVKVRAGYGGYETSGEVEVRSDRTAELDLVLDLSK